MKQFFFVSYAARAVKKRGMGFIDSVLEGPSAFGFGSAWTSCEDTLNLQRVQAELERRAGFAAGSVVVISFQEVDEDVFLANTSRGDGCAI